MKAIRCAALVAASAASLSMAQTLPLRVTVENLAPSNGVNLTPFWVGFHGGSFDLFNLNEANTRVGVERVAEDGDVGAIRGEFLAEASSGVDGVVAAPGGFAGAPVFEPGETAHADFAVNPLTGRYFSYLSMIIPSNDAFVGNANPTAFELFDGAGAFRGPISFVIGGDRVWDAGTEANTEQDAAFINQSGPDTGVPESLPVRAHPGFIGSVLNPGGTPIILGGTAASGQFIDPVNADFTRSGYEVARVTISIVPEPTAASLAALALLGLRRRR